MKKIVLSDEELISRYILGDDDSLRIIIKRHKSRIFTSIILLVKDRYLAEDFFQEAYIKAITTMKAGKYRESGKFLPWILRIAHNLVMDHFRKIQRMPIVVDSEGKDVIQSLPTMIETAEEKLIKEQTVEKVRLIIQELPDEQREVLVLRHYANLSFKEIAEITGTNMNTALGRMHYAILGMRKLIAKYNITL